MDGKPSVASLSQDMCLARAKHKPIIWKLRMPTKIRICVRNNFVGLVLGTVNNMMVKTRSPGYIYR